MSEAEGSCAEASAAARRTAKRIAMTRSNREAALARLVSAVSSESLRDVLRRSMAPL